MRFHTGLACSKVSMWHTVIPMQASYTIVIPFNHHDIIQTPLFKFVKCIVVERYFLLTLLSYAE